MSIIETASPPRPPARYDDLRALYINGTLKPSPELSHTQGLMDRSIALMREQGVAVKSLRLADYDVAVGVYPDMRAYGASADEWLEDVWPLVDDADILVVGGPLWLGENSSMVRKLIERLYAMSGEMNEAGQYVYYGKTAGTLITGNEDGVKHAAMSTLYALQHIGFVIPPAADAGWIGEVGPGPSYLDAGSGGPENDFTSRNLTFMTWNLLHVARMMKDIGGFPAYGNQRALWDLGERFTSGDMAPNPEYR